MHAQTLSSPTGEYYLRGVPETASGFQLKRDGTFQFFFSYGALDRTGQGNWKVEGDSVVMNSRPQTTTDFTLLRSDKSTGHNIVVQIDEQNKYLLPHFFCRITGGGKVQEGATDKEGTVAFAPQQVDSVELHFEFCAEKHSVFKVNAAHNRFIFKPAASLMEVLFRDFKLKRTIEGLAGGHPLSRETNFRYEKKN